MPTFVTRKKLHPTTIFDINMRLWGIWSGLDAVLKKKRLDRKKIQAYMDECCILAKKCEIRLPYKTPKPNNRIYQVCLKENPVK
jgi:hypothetical protein